MDALPDVPQSTQYASTPSSEITEAAPGQGALVALAVAEVLQASVVLVLNVFSAAAPASDVTLSTSELATDFTSSAADSILDFAPRLPCAMSPEML